MKIVVAITGASGAIYAHRLITKLNKNQEIEKIAVVFSKTALKIYNSENLPEIKESDKISLYDNDNFYVPIASGSCSYNSMIICPCSCGTLGRIANGISDSLITRAADVFLKERRKLIVVLRENPLSIIHIQNMEKITLAGGIVSLANPSFYSNPKNITDLVDTVVDRLLSLLNINNNSFRWQEN
ncbi:MAG: UbiX family flavin prenyltransferase [Bacteroidales bacterium]|nr:UbiX family flavin prenyltransferase [Bacteroidales bacterium]